MTLHSYEWGERGSPVVACLHGITSHGRHFTKLAERLAARFHVVALDLRGHGGSEYEPPWNLEQHVEDALDTLQEHGLVDEPIRWIGHSFGGRIAFEVAAAAPEAVERLVLLDPALLISGNAALNGAEACACRSLVCELRGGDRPPLRGEPALTGAARARRIGARASIWSRSATAAGATAISRAP